MLNRVKEFYPTYLEKHSKVWTRRFHFFGQVLTFAWLAMAVCLAFTKGLFFLPLVLLTPFIIYVPAWLSHWLIEGNKPATFYTPWYITKLCDLKMAWDMITGRLPS